MCVQYCGDIMSTVGDILSSMGDILSSVGDIMINVGGYLEYRGEKSLQLFEYLHCTEHPPRYS